MRRATHAIVTFTIIAIAAASYFATQTASPATPVNANPITNTQPQKGPPAVHNVGARSCASSTCHGSPKADTEQDSMIRRDEYFTWLEQDPHARAFTDLNSRLGKQIFEKLGVTRKGKPVKSRQEQYAATYSNCLQCHATRIKGRTDDPGKHLLEGVSCEACHGAASLWRTTHYTTDFTGLDATEKQRRGLANLGNVWQRTSACVKCHVGSSAAEVNHDLIAAGHPELKFEMAAYYSQMPRHWKTNADLAHKPTAQYQEADLWFIGQVASVTASLSQLLNRSQLAKQSPGHAVWPELSESNCYACHHDLDNQGTWRPSVTGLKPLLPVNDWYVSALYTLAREDQKQGNALAGEFCQAWEQLQFSLEKTLSPDPGQVAAYCQDVLTTLAAWLDPESLKPNGEHSRYSRNHILDLMAAAVSGDDLNRIMQNWDRATQTYLSLYALASTYNDQGKIELQAKASLFRARDLLAFPYHTDYRFSSPLNFKGSLTAGETTTNNRAQIRDQLLRITRELKPEPGQ